MELGQVIIIEMPDTIRRLPKATPCCRVCFEPEIPQKLFVVEDLKCECRLYLHDACVQEWFRIAGREVCPQCGHEWKVTDPCLRYESFCGRFIIIWLLVTLSILTSVGLYQIITQIYMKS
jgi:hypothetical protein